MWLDDYKNLYLKQVPSARYVNFGELVFSCLRIILVLAVGCVIAYFLEISLFNRSI